MGVIDMQMSKNGPHFQVWKCSRGRVSHDASSNSCTSHERRDRRSAGVHKATKPESIFRSEDARNDSDTRRPPTKPMLRRMPSHPPYVPPLRQSPSHASEERPPRSPHSKISCRQLKEPIPLLVYTNNMDELRNEKYPSAEAVARIERKRGGKVSMNKGSGGVHDNNMNPRERSMSRTERQRMRDSSPSSTRALPGHSERTFDDTPTFAVLGGETNDESSSSSSSLFSISSYEEEAPASFGLPWLKKLQDVLRIFGR